MSLAPHFTAGASIHLDGCTDPDAERILAWPDSLLSRIKERIENRPGPLVASDPDDAKELRDAGLLSADGSPTELGAYVAELVRYDQRQRTDKSFEFLDEVTSQPVDAVLEVGCCTGRKVRSLGKFNGAYLAGLDVDAKALTWGYRWARLEGESCDFYLGSAHALPFENDRFDRVLCRNALTYMHQATAIKEMGRVLKPGGKLLLRFENVWYELRHLMHPHGVKAAFCNLRDFVFGLTLNTFGWQPIPGRTLTGGRAFASVSRVRSLLRGQGLELTAVSDWTHSPAWGRLPTQTAVLCHKRGTTASPHNA